MRVNLAQPLRGIDGQPVVENDKTITLAQLVIGTLLTPAAKDDELTDEEKVRRFNLALRIEAQQPDCPLQIEEAALIKQLIGKHPLPLVVGRVWSTLEEAAEKEKADQPQAA